jgi:hypothetical protein
MAEVFQHATARKEKEVGRGLSPPPHYVRDDYESARIKEKVTAKGRSDSGRAIPNVG